MDQFSDKHQIYIKREDLIHPDFGGNKWRKLKYNIEKASHNQCGTIVTFGGPFSNHIAATAAVCRAYNIPCVGIIRGEYVDADNPTLNLAQNNGMILHHVSKLDYKIGDRSENIDRIIKIYDRPYMIPEGGGNALGMYGMQDLVSEIDDFPVEFDYICVPAGTGTTAAGIIEYLDGNSQVIIVNALRNASLVQMISQRLSTAQNNWEVLSNYHFGGFAKTTDELQLFTQSFYDRYGIMLDPVYNAKLVYGIVDHLRVSDISAESKVLIIHTGGMQGIDAYDYRHDKHWLYSDR